MPALPTSGKPETTAPVKIQLALQGGGAKLAFLIAALEGIQELEKEGVLKVTKVAGTSAGSIAACLFAAKVEMPLVRERFKTKMKDAVGHFSSSKAKGLWKLIWSRPIWSVQSIQEILTNFFREQEVETLGQIEEKYGISVRVIATDLSDAKKITFESDKSIVPAVIDSCAIPYLFGVWNKTGRTVIVDGGICENLPSEELDRNEELYGEIVGISFAGSPSRPPNSIINFSYSLLNTAINHSINRARRHLGSRKLFTIATRIGTFDFADAFSNQYDADYDNVKIRAKDWFRNFAKEPSDDEGPVAEIGKEEWELISKDFMMKMNTIYESHHLPSKLQYEKVTLEVTARGLENPPKPDFVQYEFEFSTLNRPIYCHRISLSKTEDDSAIQKVKIEAFGPDGPIDFVYFPLLRLDTDGSERKTVLISFIPELPPNSGPYSLRFTDVIQDFVGGLIKSEELEDVLKVTTYRAEGQMKKIEMIAHIPESFGKIIMSQSENRGAPMTGQTLSHHRKYGDFETYGWEFKDLAPNEPIQVDLRRAIESDKN